MTLAAAGMTSEQGTSEFPHRFVRGHGQHSLVLDLPALVCFDSVELDINSTTVRILIPNASPACISLPQHIQSETVGAATAKFSRKRNQLTVAWPFLTFSEEELLDVAGAVCNWRQDDGRTETCDQQADQIQSKSLSAFCAGKDVEANAAPDNDPGSFPSHGEKNDLAAPTAYGSIWNTNSWHWEEKTCTEIAKKSVFGALASAEAGCLRYVREIEGASVVLKDIEVTGKAAIWIRKGKRILSLDISVAFNWDMKDEFGGSLGAKGTGKSGTITEDDDGPSKVEIKVSSSSFGGKEARKACDWLRSHGVILIGECLHGQELARAILTADADQLNPEADQARRKEELNKTEAARQANVAIQKKIAEDQCIRESVGFQAARTGASSATASSWNVNAWHWEEKPMDRWSHAWIQSALGELRIELFGGSAEAVLSDVEVSGDASVSIRKGQSIVLFSLNVSSKWRATGCYGDARGSLKIPDFNSEDGVRSPILVEPEPRGNALVAAFRKESGREVKNIMNKFIEKLAEQLST